MQSTLTSKGQITIPIALRRKLQLKAGDVLNFDEQVPFLKAIKKIDVERMHSVIGRGRHKLRGKTSKQLIDEMRGPSDWPW